MYMKKYLHILLAVSLPQCLIAQDLQTGLLFNETRYNALPQMSLPAPVSDLGFESEDLVSAASLKPHCPNPGNQGNVASCMAWALGYGAQTIDWAKRHNMTNTAQITESAFSAMYVYNHVKAEPNSTSCGGSYPEDALNYLKTKGNVLLSQYNPNHCHETPPVGLDEAALRHKIKDFVPLFKTSDSKQRKLGFIKNAVAQGKPVVVCMRLTRTFYKATGVWEPGSDPNPYGPHSRHAMVLIGYNDAENTVEIMNSWGMSWGNAGFIKVKYDDLITYLDAAFQIVPEPEGAKIELAGQFKFHYSRNLTGMPMDDATATYNTVNAYYELSRKDWQLNQRFQLLVKNKVEGQYIYAFSVNSQMKANVHFPMGKAYNAPAPAGLEVDDVDVVPQVSEFRIPAPERAADGKVLKEKSFKIAPTGTDYLILLYAAQTLKSDLANVVETTRAGIASGLLPQKALENALGYQLMPSSAIQFEAGQVGFKASSAMGTIVPLIIRVDSQ
jgi:Papain family cysteine protease